MDSQLTASLASIPSALPRCGALRVGGLSGRQFISGLGGDWGTLRLGRQYTPVDDVAGIVGTKGYDVLSVVPIIGNGDYNRVDNAITYLSPAIAGATFQLQYSLGEERVSSNTSKDFAKQVSAHAMYGRGPITAGLSLMQVSDADGTTAGKQGKDAMLLADTAEAMRDRGPRAGGQHRRLRPRARAQRARTTGPGAALPGETLM